jgi:hypothetical protein
MTKQRWQQLKRVLSDVIEMERPAAERHLESACADDRELLAEAIRLLDLHYQSGLYLDQSIFDAAAFARAAADDG